MVHQRLCPCCRDGQSIESEEHFIFFCPKYNNLRQAWLNQLNKSENFLNLESAEKFKIIFDQAENVKFTAQYIVNCYDLRSKIVSIL